MISRRGFLSLGMMTVGAMAAPAIFATPKALPLGAIRLRSPTAPQVRLDGSDLTVFMDTGTGRPESGMFGNTRRDARGAPRFHEGIDIAPAQPWSRRKVPTDTVVAAADGVVLYMNTHAKNPSLYGNYVVLRHEVHGFGQIYTLYAHLRRFDKALRLGREVKAGTALGTLGNVPDIPVARSHLHFEIGVIMNNHYPLIDDDHGVWNGANLYGIDPCDAFKEQYEKGYFDIASYIKQRPVAFSYVVDGALHPMPDYFKRYPSLCRTLRAGEPYVVNFSREGIPVACFALAAIYPMPQTPPMRVLYENATEVAKGRRYVKHGKLTPRGEKLMDNLFVSPAYLPKGAQALGEIG